MAHSNCPVPCLHHVRHDDGVFVDKLAAKTIEGESDRRRAAEVIRKVPRAKPPTS